MKRYRWFVVAGLGLVAVLTGFLLANIGDDLVYYQTPSEVRADAARVDSGRFRLGGQVVPGTIVAGDDGVRFSVTDGIATVPVDHEGAPQQLFREGIGVVVEGSWDGDTFHSDSMIIKHDEQYRTEDGGVYTPDDRYPEP
jgi:cytochrome c-type biogenesis protein CcmE